MNKRLTVRIIPLYDHGHSWESDEAYLESEIAKITEGGRDVISTAIYRGDLLIITRPLRDDKGS
ncbi:hypothetical protein MYX84_16115 [Acidobacteria bacterium AH-259-O06]|nr:hypothetical protein [Acidobacteria bacterium AH-259-O06]